MDADRQHAKLSDFGLAKFKAESAPHTVCGTPTHMAPEVTSFVSSPPPLLTLPIKGKQITSVGQQFDV